jgi:hypothetical protein
MFNILNLNQHLDSDEKIIKFFRPSRKAYMMQYIGLIILIFFSLYIMSKNFFPKIVILDLILFYMGCIILLYAIGMLIRIEYRIFSRRYALTSERMMYSRGIFNEFFRSSSYRYATDIEFEQTFWDKIVDTGTLKINTAGTDNYEIRYRKISQPLKIKKQINDLQNIKINPLSRKKSSND